MVFCVKCGFEITEKSSKFCPKCGTNVFQNSKTDSKVHSVSPNSTKTPSKKGMSKLTVLSIAGIIIIGIIMLPSIIGFDEGQNAANFQMKKMECNSNGDWLYIDIFENFCCTSEKHTVFESNGPVCPKLEFIYP